MSVLRRTFALLAAGGAAYGGWLYLQDDATRDRHRKIISPTPDRALLSHKNSFAAPRIAPVTFAYLGPMLRALIDPELAHRMTIGVFALSPGIRHRLGLQDASPSRPSLHVRAFGLTFANPVGIAAGFDKHCEAVHGLWDIGFGFVEIGSVTPEPQPGNEQPRVFRLEPDRAIINRYGFNSDGCAAVKDRLTATLKARQSSLRPKILGVNLGKNKTSADSTADYVRGVQELGPAADYLVVNISSPNTPGLRALQSKESLRQLLTAVKSARDALPIADPHRHSPARPPLLLKVAPDLTSEDAKDIAAVAIAVGIDGLIISNTTIARPPTLRSEFRQETGEASLLLAASDHLPHAYLIVEWHCAGGLSGEPLFHPSTKLVGTFYQLTKGQIPIVGVGGISTGLQAYQKIRQGATLVQLYTAFAYDGPLVVARVKHELAELLARDGFKSVMDAVGADFRVPKEQRAFKDE